MWDLENYIKLFQDIQAYLITFNFLLLLQDFDEYDEEEEKTNDSKIHGYNTFKEINNNSKSLLTVADFGNSEFESSKLHHQVQKDL